ncbi:MAG: component of the polarisome [Trizodia sp. TS-e1964]|nr:MAG: component of the polarisome [Trizodia sp. TS-e1964]
MSARADALSPLSVDDSASDWSGITRYHGPNSEVHSPYSPLHINIHNARSGTPVTPPVSSGSSITMVGAGSLLNGGGGHPGGPSPPSSVARSSDSAGPYASSEYPQQKRKTQLLEEALLEHYLSLKRYLAVSLNDEKGNPRPNRARDKLLRLSSVQFQELSTDVFDELLRRQSAPDPRGHEQVPPYLQPKDTFHPKRNQARQKLSTLPGQRFRELATDVFFELERRFPRFTAGDLDRTASPASAMQARNGPLSSAPNGAYNGNLSANGPRSESRESARSIIPRGKTPTGINPFSRAGSNGVSPVDNARGYQSQSVSNEFGRPLPKTFQSNTIIPNKSTMVEDDDEYEENEGQSFGQQRHNFDRRPSEINTSKSLSFDLRQDRTSERGLSQNSTSRSRADADGDQQTLNNYRAQIMELEEKNDQLEKRLRESDEELGKLREQSRYAQRRYENVSQSQGRILPHPTLLNSPKAANDERREWSEQRTDLESKLADAKNLSASLQSDLAQLRSDHSNMEKDLREQLNQAMIKSKSAYGGSDESNKDMQNGASGAEGDYVWKSQYEDLQKEFEGLKMELLDQQQVTEEVKNEATGFLKEMQLLSEMGYQPYEREETLLNQVHKLEQEVIEWKSRYARTKTQLRSLRASSGLSSQFPNVAQHAKEASFTSHDGLVRDVHITKFQIAIDELLRMARSNDASSVLDQMKAVVVCVRLITQDIGDIPSADNKPPQSGKLKARVSATANNLITAAKNFAASNGISPVSLLDAAASHLTTAVVELIRVVKIRQTPADELEEEDNMDKNAPLVGLAPGSSTVALNTAFSERMSGDSVYSAASSPRSPARSKESWAARRPSSRNGLSHSKLTSGLKSALSNRAQDNEVEELKVYLEDQTESLVLAIQALVSSIRADDTISLVLERIEGIAAVVGRVVSSTETTMNQSENTFFRERATSVLHNLVDCRMKLLGSRSEGERITDASKQKQFYQKLPPLAFEIARETKELVQRIDSIENKTQDLDEDVFR